MTPAQLAALHHAAFLHDRGWTAAEFTALLASPHVTLHCREQGFALHRTVADESELLTLAVHPAHRRTGTGGMLIADWLAHAHSRAATAFLEVAADNDAALSLYHAAGLVAVARRPGYYRRLSGVCVDAVVMRGTQKPAQDVETG